MADRVDITVPIESKPVGLRNALPIRLGCGFDGEEIGHIAGSSWPAGMKVTPSSLDSEAVAEIWVNLDPDALATIPAVQEAVQRALSAMERITHGRHCTCSACEQEDWTNPRIGPCGMHGSSCPREYAPLGPAGSYHEPVIDDQL